MEASTPALDHTGQDEDNATTNVEVTPDPMTQARKGRSGNVAERRGKEPTRIAVFTPVWKCRARCDAKSAAKVAPRKYNPKRSVSGTWRCDNRVVDEDAIVSAVSRALSLFPGEVENIRHIQEQAREVLEESRLPRSGKGNRAVKGRSTVGSTAPGSTAASTAPSTPATTTDGNNDSNIGKRVDKKVAAAQLLLIHTYTALEYLSAAGGEGSGACISADSPSPLRDFEEFAAMETKLPAMNAAATTTPEMTTAAMQMKAEALDLIDAVVVDGDRISVRFKAGVEI